MTLSKKAITAIRAAKEQLPRHGDVIRLPELTVAHGGFVVNEKSNILGEGPRVLSAEVYLGGAPSVGRLKDWSGVSFRLTIKESWLPRFVGNIEVIKPLRAGDIVDYWAGQSEHPVQATVKAVDREAELVTIATAEGLAVVSLHEVKKVKV